jgi:CheY-like chemotaxis protein
MPFGDGQLVLVVEDDPMVREATLKRFEALGYAVLEAANGIAAKNLLEQGEPVDLVFTDVVMPGGVSGYDLVHHIQRHYPDIAVLMTSGHLSQLPRPGMGSDRLPELLKKPYSLETLAEAAHHALKITPPPE